MLLNYATSLNDVGFEALTAVTMKSIIFGDVMTCSPVALLLAGFWLGLLFNPEDGCTTGLQNAGELLLDYMALHPR
jgi:hypothetical protein